MSCTTVSRSIHAPVDLFFRTVAIISEFSNAAPKITKVEFLSVNRSGLGCRFRETRLMKGREVTMELEVTRRCHPTNPGWTAGRRSHMRYAIAVLTTLFLAACEAPNEVISPGTITYPYTVSLHPGQSIRLPQIGLTATFDSVTADSRCPLGAECVWQGDGATRLSVRRDPGDAVTCTLHTTLDPKLVDVDGISVQLVDLLPYPRASVPLSSGAYTAVLQIGPFLGIR